MVYTIAAVSDTHLGYSARCRTNSRGVNVRIMDGLKGFNATVTDIIDADVDLVVHCGDLFHRSAPQVGEIAFARQQLERLAAANIPVLGATGNHDHATDRGKAPATAAVNDPHRDINMVTGDLRIFHPVDGLNVQVLSHAGLIAAQRVTPTPIDGEVSVLVTHGAAQVPGSPVFSCVDSPGEAVIGYDLLSAPWAVSLLGHYHARGPLPGFHDGDTGQAWYAGSLLRRGFSDPPGGRGWLLVTINDDGTVTVEPRNVTQRAQHDLVVIDAADLTGSDVEERIRANLDSVDMTEEPIIRQRVINCPVSVRRGVDAAALTAITQPALVWQLEFIRPPLAEINHTDGDAGQDGDNPVAASIATASGADLPATWGTWFDGYADGINMPPAQRPTVRDAGAELLRQVSAHVETIDTTPDTQAAAS